MSFAATTAAAIVADIFFDILLYQKTSTMNSDAKTKLVSNINFNNVKLSRNVCI